jgi:hypothetical protein
MALATCVYGHPLQQRPQLRQLTNIDTVETIVVLIVTVLKRHGACPRAVNRRSQINGESTGVDAVE